METFFANVDLSLAERNVRGCFHTSGPGRPPRNPLGLLRAFIVMRMKAIRSLRELTRLFGVDPRLRRLCLIREGERGYPRSVLSSFTRWVGTERLWWIIDEKVVMLMRRSRVREVDVVLDASFIKAWSIRHPHDSRRGYSDPDARVVRNGRTYDLGYKLHLSIDHRRILPLASVLAPANENEKKHGPTLLERTKQLLRKAGARLRGMIADSQYSSEKIRQEVEEAIIPYPANQRRGEVVLRVDRKFRTHGPEEQRREYHKRPAVESAYAFLKTQYSMAVNKVRGLRKVAIYALYSILCHVLNREAAENIGRPNKAVSPTFFNT
ncbi:MAG: transposase [Candidatus Bathyarchaeia archaeon]